MNRQDAQHLLVYFDLGIRSGARDKFVSLVADDGLSVLEALKALKKWNEHLQNCDLKSFKKNHPESSITDFVEGYTPNYKRRETSKQVTAKSFIKKTNNTYKNKGKKWSIAQNNKVKRLYERGYNVKEIACEMERTEGSIILKLNEIYFYNWSTNDTIIDEYGNRKLK